MARDYKYELDLSGNEPILIIEGTPYRMKQVAVAINAYEKKKATIYNSRKRKKTQKSEEN